MKTINSIEALKAEIVLLETINKSNGIALKLEFNTVYESLKPLNLFLKTVKDLSNSSELKDDLLSASIGLGAGYLGKLAIVGKPSNPIKQLMGSIVQVGITSFVSNNGVEIISNVSSIINHLFSKKKKEEIL
jgi:hypothetical protein